jgi:hypothetical protein
MCGRSLLPPLKNGYDRDDAIENQLHHHQSGSENSQGEEER